MMRVTLTVCKNQLCHFVFESRRMKKATEILPIVKAGITKACESQSSLIALTLNS